MSSTNIRYRADTGIPSESPVTIVSVFWKIIQTMKIVTNERTADERRRQEPERLRVGHDATVFFSSTNRNGHRMVELYAATTRSLAP